MPQLSFDPTMAAYKLEVTISVDPLAPLGPMELRCTTFGASGKVQTTSSERFIEMEVDYVPSALQAIAEGYLWGDSWQAPHKALRNVKRAARDARLSRERTGS